VTNRRGTVSTDHATNHTVPKQTVSPSRPIQIGRSGSGIGVELGDGVEIAETPRIDSPLRPPSGASAPLSGTAIPPLPAAAAVGASVSVSDISATIGHPRASARRSSRFASPAANALPGC